MNGRFQRRRFRAQVGAMNWPVLSLVVGIIIVIGIVVFLFYPLQISESIVSPAEPDQPISTTTEERGDTARETIEQLDSNDDPVKYDEAYSRAQAFRQEGRLADAQLLFFYAARGGHGPAAFDLATMYDPNHHSSESSLLDEPDPFQAYKWYKQAEAKGHANTGDRLAELQTWARSAADAGNMNAEQLLLIWE